MRLFGEILMFVFQDKTAHNIMAPRVGCNQWTHVYAGVIQGTLDDARIHMGIPLTLHDVCKH